MRSIREIFVVGHGPSSSHTMGPSKACEYILNKYNNIKHIKVVLYGSLALTGKGHLTDYIIDLKLKDYSHEIVFDIKTKVTHPNTMRFFLTLENNKKVEEEVISIGGGTIITYDNKKSKPNDVYPHSTLKEISEFCKENKLEFWQYVEKFEGPGIREYLSFCFKQMMETSRRGITTEGYLPGPLHIKRKAKDMYEKYIKEPPDRRSYELIMATASLATSEENASGGTVVIAPTCGSSGVIPGVLAYLERRGNTMEEIYRGLLTAGLIGILCKTNGSVSGAEAGCQAEIGVACSMAAALIATAKGLGNDKVAQSAEIALEHSLGLTCDPVQGYVIIPCIERNAMYALKARNAVTLASLIPTESSMISFDDSVKTMLQTGRDLKSGYRETGEEGLSKLFKEKHKNKRP